MTAQSKKWSRLARDISESYTMWDETLAVTLGGSVAREIADDSSDIDIFVFCTSLPSEQQRTDAVNVVNGKGWKRHDQMQEWGIVRDCFHLNGARIDIGYFLEITAQNLIDDVLVRYDTMPIKQGFLGGLLDAVPLHGQDVIKHWQDQVREYPDGLRLAVIQAHLWMDPLWIPEIYSNKRGDFLMLQDAMVKTSMNVLGMLSGLNRIYQTAEWKRIQVQISKMEYAPINLFERLADVFHIPNQKRVASLTSIVEETFSLIETHMPELNVGAARIAFKTDTDTN